MDGDVVARWEAPDAGCVARGRERAGVQLKRIGLDEERRGDADLLVSELLANALQHGRPPVVLLVWRCVLHCAVVEVHDAGERMPVVPAPEVLAELDPMAESGRGLALMAALSQGRCGVLRLHTSGGKGMWFSLPLTVPQPAPVSVATLVATRVCTREVSTVDAAIFAPGSAPGPFPRPRAPFRPGAN